MKTVAANLVIELNVECPHCEHFFDLLSETDLNDEGFLIRDAISDDRWSVPANERIECDEVYCPECEKVFAVRGLNW